MAPTIYQVMQGIRSRLATISNLETREYLPDQIMPPIAIVGVPPITEYRTTFGRGRFTLEPTVTILVSARMDQAGQTDLAKYADVQGATSIPAAIEGDRTLGGVVEECWVLSFRPMGMEDLGRIGYYGGVFNLRTIAEGT